MVAACADIDVSLLFISPPEGAGHNPNLYVRYIFVNGIAFRLLWVLPGVTIDTEGFPDGFSSAKVPVFECDAQKAALWIRNVDGW